MIDTHVYAYSYTEVGGVYQKYYLKHNLSEFKRLRQLDYYNACMERNLVLDSPAYHAAHSSLLNLHLNKLTKKSPTDTAHEHICKSFLEMMHSSLFREVNYIHSPHEVTWRYMHVIQFIRLQFIHPTLLTVVVINTLNDS